MTPPTNSRPRPALDPIEPMRWLALLLALIGALSLATACGQSRPTEMPDQPAQEDRPLIGFAMDTLVIERWESDRNILVAAVGELGGETIVQNANSDAVEQKNQIRFLIEKGVDVLIIVAIDENQLDEEIALAEERGIDVIAYDRMIKHHHVDLYISFDNVEVGRLMAEAMVKAKPGGRYMIMKGAITDNNTTLVREGIQSVLDDHPDCRVVAEAIADNWSADDAYAKFRTLLNEQPDIDGILCGNDALAGSAVRALAIYQQSGKVAVTGQDADLDACQRIVEGRQLMTVYKPIGVLAKTAAKAAMALANGDSPAANDVFMVQATPVPYDRIEPIAVDLDNIDAVIIDSGFHDASDVYRNVPSQSEPSQTGTSQSEPSQP